MLSPRSPVRRSAAALLVSLVLVTGACSGERPSLADDAERATSSTTTAAPTTTTTEPAAAAAAEVATAKETTIDVFADEGATEADRQIVSGVDTSVNTIPIVFLVKTPVDGERVEVYLPVRPNGSSGWVDAADVDISTVPYRIEVGISEKRIRVFNGEEMIVDEPVGVGRADRPTPGGVYYLKELLQPPEPGGPYGSFAYGLSGFSNVLTSFAGGPGVIGIHGTNDPSSVGGDVSSGCIRLQNDVIERMVDEIGLPLGTPVDILA
ncbi:MAG: L,D-transpeptidase [Acidimicrobiales bacterium]